MLNYTYHPNQKIIFSQHRLQVPIFLKKFDFRLEDQKEDCQTKFGCRIEFMDLEIMKQIDKKVFKDLCQKIVDNCISEDDFNYFHLQDDSAKIQKTFFDL